MVLDTSVPICWVTPPWRGLYPLSFPENNVNLFTPSFSISSLHSHTQPTKQHVFALPPPSRGILLSNILARFMRSISLPSTSTYSFPPLFSPIFSRARRLSPLSGDPTSILFWVILVRLHLDFVALSFYAES